MFEVSCGFFIFPNVTY